MATYRTGPLGPETFARGGPLALYQGGGRAAGSFDFMNALAGLGKKAGPWAVGIPIALAAGEQLMRDSGDPLGNVVGGTGAVAGGLGGAKLGAMLGSVVPGAGTGIGALIGGGLGAVLGSSAGGDLARGAVDWTRGRLAPSEMDKMIRDAEAMARSQNRIAAEGMPIRQAELEMQAEIARRAQDEQAARIAQLMYQQQLLGAARPPVGAYTDPGFMSALGSVG